MNIDKHIGNKVKDVIDVMMTKAWEIMLEEIPLDKIYQIDRIIYDATWRPITNSLNVIKNNINNDYR
jgi:hypothetical protein